ncbi:MAG: glutathione synthase, partial [Phenylobacterium sp.]|nr:glutathione synthase [Phenylobacterium sp.]
MSPQTRGLAQPQPDAAPTRPPGETYGLATLARACSEPERLQALWDGLVARATADAADSAAFLDLGTLLIGTGQRDKGLELQAAAIADQPHYRRPAPGEPRLRVLAFMTQGDFTANTPLDFLLEGSDVELISCYIDGPPAFAAVPDHDLAFLAIGESEEAAPLLGELQGALAGWPRPVLNSRADLIAGLTRDGVADRFANHPKVLCPVVRRVPRAALVEVAGGGRTLFDLAEGLQYPVIVRPVGTHAGLGMERLADGGELHAYLAARAEAEFYVTAFFDYSGADGLYRKLRVVFIQGRPFLSHMAVSTRWMIHYLNADMHESEAKRAEEAAMMASFDQGFAARHAEA